MLLLIFKNIFHFFIFFLYFFYEFFFLFFHVPGCSGMFWNVPACSGMFHVPGFIDGPFKDHGPHRRNDKSEYQECT